MTGSVITVKEDETYIAKDVCTCVASQGKTAEEALDNLRIGLELYYATSKDPTDKKRDSVRDFV